MLSILLPWPDRRLLGNARNGIACARARAEARALSAAAVRNALQHGQKEPAPQVDGLFYMAIELAPPAKGNNPDDDNALAGCKSYRDGLADGLNLDDRRFRLQAVYHHPRVDKGWVVLRLGLVKQSAPAWEGEGAWDGR